MNTIKVQWKGGMRFDGTDAAGRTVGMDAAVDRGGRDEGFRPTDMLLLSLAGCSSISLGNVLVKMHLAYDSFEAVVEGDRNPEPPQVFTAIRVHYTVSAPGVTPEKFLKALELGLKYCSVANMVKKACPVAYAFTLNGTRHEYTPAG